MPENRKSHLPIPTPLLQPAKHHHPERCVSHLPNEVLFDDDGTCYQQGPLVDYPDEDSDDDEEEEEEDGRTTATAPKRPRLIS